MALLASLTGPEVDVRFYDDRMETIPFDEPTDLVAISVETVYGAYGHIGLARSVSRPWHPGGDGWLSRNVMLLTKLVTMADAIVIGDADEMWAQMLRTIF